MSTRTKYITLRKAVAEWLREEFTPHLNKDGTMRDEIRDDKNHGHPDDCLQCRVEMELL